MYRRAHDPGNAAGVGSAINIQPSLHRIGRIQHEVDIAQELFGRELIKARRAWLHQYTVIGSTNSLGQNLDLQLANVSLGKGDLSRQITERNPVIIHDTKTPHSSARKVLRHRDTQAARAHNQYMGITQPKLPLHVNLGDNELASVSTQLLVRQLAHCPPVMRGCPDQSDRVLTSLKPASLSMPATGSA